MQPEPSSPWIADVLHAKHVFAWEDERTELKVSIALRGEGTRSKRWLLIIENGEPRLERIEPPAKPEDGAE